MILDLLYWHGVQMTFALIWAGVTYALWDEQRKR